MQELNNTAHKLLDFAEQFTQTRGFNGFSYKDLQREVGVKTSTIHYYFPTKQDLALVMTERFVHNFRGHLEKIAQEEPNGVNRLEKLGSLFVEIVEAGRFCMCGMLASDMYALPDCVNDRLVEFFQITEDWTLQAIETAKEQDNISASVNAKSAAAHYVSALEGGMLIARIRKQPEYLKDIVNETLYQLKR